VDIEYGRGAAFLLTDADHLALAALLRTTADKVASQGLEVIGYYQSHTRRGASLEETDLETYDRHFSDPQMVCIVLRPEKENATTISVYVRDEQGNIIQATALEEVLERPVSPPEPPKALAQAVGAAANYETNPLPDTRAFTPTPSPAVQSLQYSPLGQPATRKWIPWAFAIPVIATLVGVAMWVQHTRSDRSRTLEPPPATTQQAPLPTAPAEQSPTPTPPPETTPAAEITPNPAENATAKSKQKTKRAKQAQSRRARTRTTDR